MSSTVVAALLLVNESMSDAEARDGQESKSALEWLGKRMRDARTRAGLSAEHVEKMTGVKTKTLLRWERGEVEPGALKLAALAKVYGVTCDWLLGLSSSPDNCENGQAVLDLDQVDEIERVKCEEEVERQLLWRPPPFLAVIALPVRRKLVSLQQAIDVGSSLLAKVKSTGPRSYARWVSIHMAGG